MYTPREAARAWIRALGVFGDKAPSYFFKDVWHCARRVGLRETEALMIYSRAQRERPTAYLRGWLGIVPTTPWGPQREDNPDWERGYVNGMRALEVLRHAASGRCISYTAGRICGRPSEHPSAPLCDRHGGRPPAHYTPQEAARAWIRATGIYAALDGRDAPFIRRVGGAAHAVGISREEMEQIYRSGKSERPTPYLMGWVTAILRADWAAGLKDHQLPVRLIGQFDEDPDYQRGLDDAIRAAEVLLDFASQKGIYPREETSREEELLS
jgi:hypothetical protein